MPSSVDADQLVKWNEAGELSGCLVEGPISMDVALDKEAAEHKGIQSQVSGEVDLFLVPTIDVGNIVGKALTHLAGAKMSGIVLGARAPIVLVSRSDDAESKLNALAMACACI